MLCLFLHRLILQKLRVLREEGKNDEKLTCGMLFEGIKDQTF